MTCSRLTATSSTRSLSGSSSEFISDKELEEAKLNLLRENDAVPAPLDRGRTEFIGDISRAEAQHKRQAWKNATKEEVVEVARRCLLESMMAGRTSRIVIGSPNEVDMNRIKKERWTFRNFLN